MKFKRDNTEKGINASVIFNSLLEIEKFLKTVFLQNNPCLIKMHSESLSTVRIRIGSDNNDVYYEFIVFANGQINYINRQESLINEYIVGLQVYLRDKNAKVYVRSNE